MGKGKGSAALRLVLDVAYDANGEDVGQLRRRLEQVAHNAMSRGEVTGDSAATVALWDSRVEELLPEGVGLIPLQSGMPAVPGVYACRVPIEGLRYAGNPFALTDKFLMWHEGRWYFPKSTEGYRGEVVAFAGPLQRKLPPQSEKPDAPQGGA